MQASAAPCANATMMDNNAMTVVSVFFMVERVKKDYLAFRSAKVVFFVKYHLRKANYLLPPPEPPRLPPELWLLELELWLEELELEPRLPLL